MIKWQYFFKLRVIVKDFLNRNGDYILLSSFISKFLSFLTSIFLIRIISSSDFGILAYSMSILSFFIPFSGGGMHFSYLRFAPNHKSNDRQRLFSNTLFIGFLFSILTILFLFYLISKLNIKDSLFYNVIYLLSLYQLSYFVTELIKINFLVESLNKRFAFLEIIISFSIFIFGIIFAYIFGLMGYVYVYVFFPLICVLPYLNLKSLKIKLPKKYISYGIWVGIGSIASQLLYSIDIFLIGNIIKNNHQIALYKSASIIPMAIFFIPNSFLKSFYTDLAKNSKNKIFIIKFLKDYLSIFFVVTICLFSFLFIFSKEIILIFFGLEYLDCLSSYKILLIGSIGAFLLRIPFGNLLAALGKSDWNAFISIALILMNILMNIIFIPNYGINGAAIVTSFLFWLSGLISLFMSLIYVFKLD